MRRSFLIILSVILLAGTGFAAPVPNYQLVVPATYSWIDIVNPGNDTGINCDDCSVNRSIGFNFNHYGNIYSNVNISSNGYLTFSGSASNYSNTDIPSTGQPNDYIAPFWDDLDIRVGGARIYSATVGTAPNRKFVVTYSNVGFYSGNAVNLTFQVILSEAEGSITFQYQNMLSVDPGRGSGSSATIGIENSNGTAGLTYSVNAASSVSDGLAIKIVVDLDTDNDGFPDSWEIDYGTDPNDDTDPVATEDVDGDGLDWTEEFVNATSPLDADTDDDAVNDGEEVSNGTNPAVNSGPITATAAGPGVEFGTAYYEFDVVGPLVPDTTGFRVYYGASSGTSIEDYDAFLDINNTVDRSGYIDKEWGMNGVPQVYFRIASVSTIGGLKYVGPTLSNELSTYFAGLKDDQALDPDLNVDPNNDGSEDEDDGSSCFIKSIENSFK